MRSLFLAPLVRTLSEGLPWNHQHRFWPQARRVDCRFERCLYFARHRRAQGAPLYGRGLGIATDDGRNSLARQVALCAPAPCNFMLNVLSSRTDGETWHAAQSHHRRSSECPASNLHTSTTALTFFPGRTICAPPCPRCCRRHTFRLRPGCSARAGVGKLPLPPEKRPRLVPYAS